MNRKLTTTMFAIALLGGLLVPGAVADQGDKAVLFSVNAPVEIPGRVLGPGRYELCLQDDGSPVAEIWSVDRPQFYGYFETVPVDRTHAGRSRVVLAGSGKHAPKRIQAWFYTSDRSGNELVYPNKHNAQLVATTSTHQQMNR